MISQADLLADHFVEGFFPWLGGVKSGSLGMRDWQEEFLMTWLHKIVRGWIAVAWLSGMANVATADEPLFVEVPEVASIEFTAATTAGSPPNSKNV